MHTTAVRPWISLNSEERLMASRCYLPQGVDSARMQCWVYLAGILLSLPGLLLS